MSQTALQLEWQVDPDKPRGGVAKGALAWCGCGWREFQQASTYTNHATGRRENETHEAERRFQWHKGRCPFRATADVGPNGAVA